MEQIEPKYNNLFTVEERKKIIAQMMAEMRKSKGLSQKEVAAEIGVSQATYSAYERGRNEPPAENIVRLSYVLGCSVDLLVQRDRTYRDAVDIRNQVQQYQQEMEQIKIALDENGGNNETTKALIDVMQKLGDALMQSSQSPEIANSINEPLKK